MKIDERKINGRNPASEYARKLQDSPENLAIKALTFLAQDVEEMERFLSLTGLGIGDLRSVAGEPGFLAAVLDHIAGQEALLERFAAEARCDPADILRARYRLEPPEADLP